MVLEKYFLKKDQADPEKQKRFFHKKAKPTALEGSWMGLAVGIDPNDKHFTDRREARKVGGYVGKEWVPRMETSLFGLMLKTRNHENESDELDLLLQKIFAIENDGLTSEDQQAFDKLASMFGQASVQKSFDQWAAIAKNKFVVEPERQSRNLERQKQLDEQELSRRNSEDYIKESIESADRRLLRARQHR